MTTKDQERKALEQIREIVESLGEDSYIGMAMIGVLEDAKQNIENDWACSNYDRWQMAEQRVEELKQEVITLRENMIRAEEDTRIAAEEQIIRLKAKLYDMMIEKEEQ